MAVIIAIDGPSASGKGTLTRMLAQKLNYDYLDTGALYRTLAYFVIKENIAISQIDNVLNLIPTINFELSGNLSLSEEKIGQMASKLAVEYSVREALNDIQRKFPTGKVGVVIDGRDIGTVIFPQADCKFFITASLEVRALRRFKQLQSAGKDIIFDQVLRDLRERDERDKNRKVAPTMPAYDALVVDTTNLDADAVLNLVYNQTLVVLRDKNINK
jgi:cytidylate kinase